MKFVSIYILGNYVKSEHRFSCILLGFEEYICIYYRYITWLHCINNTFQAVAQFG